MVLTLARFTLLGRPSQPKALPQTVVPRASFPFSKARKDFILIADVQFVPLNAHLSAMSKPLKLYYLSYIFLLRICTL